MGRGVSSGGGQSSLGYLFGSGEPASNAQVVNANSQGAQVASANSQGAQVASANSQGAQGANANSQGQPANANSPGQPANANSSPGQPANAGRTQNAGVASPPVDKQIPAGIPGNLKNNYHRADGQNCGNFLTDRPSTKVHAAPGGGSSLDYLFGGPPPGNN